MATLLSSLFLTFNRLKFIHTAILNNFFVSPPFYISAIELLTIYSLLRAVTQFFCFSNAFFASQKSTTHCEIALRSDYDDEAKQYQVLVSIGLYLETNYSMNKIIINKNLYVYVLKLKKIFTSQFIRRENRNPECNIQLVCYSHIALLNAKEKRSALQGSRVYRISI